MWRVPNACFAAVSIRLIFTAHRSGHRARSPRRAHPNACRDVLTSGSTAACLAAPASRLRAAAFIRCLADCPRISVRLRRPTHRPTAAGASCINPRFAQTVVRRSQPRAAEPADSALRRGLCDLLIRAKLLIFKMAGATGLEPATFGVTGRIFSNEINGSCNFFAGRKRSKKAKSCNCCAGSLTPGPSPGQRAGGCQAPSAG